MLDGHRKSVEPMAARLKTIDQGSEDYEQALQQFLNQSPWDEQTILDVLQTWIAGQFGGEGVLIIDDTGVPKQGQHSVGVARQYTGTLGKVASCQVAVTLQYATATEVVGLDGHGNRVEAEGFGYDGLGLNAENAGDGSTSCRFQVGSRSFASMELNIKNVS